MGVERLASFVFMVVSFGFSAYFSIQSINSYVVLNSYESVANWFGVLFFLLGLFAAFFFLRKRR